jgi:hypothetical protein
MLSRLVSLSMDSRLRGNDVLMLRPQGRLRYSKAEEAVTPPRFPPTSNYFHAAHFVSAFLV